MTSLRQGEVLDVPELVANGRLLPWLSGLDSEMSEGKACFWGPLGQWGTLDGLEATSKGLSEQMWLGPHLQMSLS